MLPESSERGAVIPYRAACTPPHTSFALCSAFSHASVRALPRDVCGQHFVRPHAPSPLGPHSTRTTSISTHHKTDSAAALVKRGSRSGAQRFSHSTREFPSSRSRRNMNLIHTCTGRPYEFKCAFSGGYAVDTDVLLTWQNTVTGEITSLRRYMTFWPPSSPDPKYPPRGIMWVNHKQWKLHSRVALADRADTGDVLDAEYKLSRRATTAWEMRRQGVQRDCEDAPPTRCFLP